MKRDWDLLRQILINVEDEKKLFNGLDIRAVSSEMQLKQDALLLGHLELLTVNGYIKGAEVVRSTRGFAGYSAANPRLSMAGHDLLDTMRSYTLWEQIKTTAKEKKLELTFTVIKTLAPAILGRLMK